MFQFATNHSRSWHMILCLGFLVAAGLSGVFYLVPNNKIQNTIQMLSNEYTNLDTTHVAANNSVAIENLWGVKLQGIHVTAAGHMLDFRFQVTDPSKAAPLLDTKNKPTVIIEDSGIKLEVPNTPRIGSLRQTSKQVKEGMIFTILFANPGKMVATGQKLTVHIGDFSVEHIAVGDILNPPPKTSLQ
jgi:hypothetical protein